MKSKAELTSYLPSELWNLFRRVLHSLPFSHCCKWLSVCLPLSHWVWVCAFFIMRIFHSNSEFFIGKCRKKWILTEKNSNERIITLFLIVACTAINISRHFSANILFGTVETMHVNRHQNANINPKLILRFISALHGSPQSTSTLNREREIQSLELDSLRWQPYCSQKSVCELVEWSNEHEQHLLCLASIFVLLWRIWIPPKLRCKKNCLFTCSKQFDIFSLIYLFSLCFSVAIVLFFSLLNFV